MHLEESQDSAKPGLESCSPPVLKQTAAGWTIQMLDASGTNILNLAVFPTKFLAEEALSRMLKRRAG